MKVIELINTCNARPTQWEGLLEDGRMVYIRYRWSWLTIQVSKNNTIDIDDAIGEKAIFSEKIGEGDFGGFMEYKELVKLTGHILDYSAIKEA